MLKNKLCIKFKSKIYNSPVLKKLNFKIMQFIFIIYFLIIISNNKFHMNYSYILFLTYF